MSSWETIFKGKIRDELLQKLVNELFKFINTEV